ncbi:MAG: SDR family NAD(P)-dependent oxidoreductase, partial [Candidatus Eremiobacteraeota bacterium]|nr:SDR family NAD(P)-dependent oxidoreductase [Candidatus Eremiobacteraeota bacterium]
MKKHETDAILRRLDAGKEAVASRRSVRRAEWLSPISWQGRRIVFEGRVALVTGGTRGIGAAITQCLVESGASVAAGYSRGKENAQKFVDQLGGEGSRVSIHQGRVDDAADCNRVVKEVMDRFGRVDYLVNNAGITVDKTVRKMTVDDWRQVLDVNLSCAFQMTKAVLEHMIERGNGRIVNISSVIGETGNVG